MSEVEFIEAIDPFFCFDSIEDYYNATKIACHISDNAVLMVGYLLAGQSSSASLDVNLELLELMKNERPTDVVIASIPVIEACLRNESAPQEKIEGLFDACSEHTNAWNGLCIVECASESMHEKCEAIRERWRSESNS
ncbi:MAG: hypothetical protein ACYSWO_28795 [Planctomycetota bacterium]|jgi:hypothetical protein